MGTNYTTCCNQLLSLHPKEGGFYYQRANINTGTQGEQSHTMQGHCEKKTGKESQVRKQNIISRSGSFLLWFVANRQNVLGKDIFLQITFLINFYLVTNGHIHLWEMFSPPHKKWTITSCNMSVRDCKKEIRSSLVAKSTRCYNTEQWIYNRVLVWQWINQISNYGFVLFYYYYQKYSVSAEKTEYTRFDFSLAHQLSSWDSCVLKKQH